jgi:hypothetical protein
MKRQAPNASAFSRLTEGPGDAIAYRSGEATRRGT